MSRRRTAAKYEQAEHVDLEARIVLARGDTRELASLIARLTENDIYAPDGARPEVPRKSAATPVPWMQPTDVQHAYGTALKHVAQAHWHLSDATDEPHWLTDLHLKPVSRAQTIEPAFAWVVTRWLDALFAAVQRRERDLLPGERDAVAKAVDEAQAAWKAIPSGWRLPPSADEEPERCVNDPCPNPRRPRGRECYACAKHRERHQSARPVEKEDAA